MDTSNKSLYTVIGFYDAGQVWFVPEPNYAHEVVSDDVFIVRGEKLYRVTTEGKHVPMAPELVETYQRIMAQLYSGHDPMFFDDPWREYIVVSDRAATADSDTPKKPAGRMDPIDFFAELDEIQDTQDDASYRAQN